MVPATPFIDGECFERLKTFHQGLCRQAQLFEPAEGYSWSDPTIAASPDIGGKGMRPFLLGAVVVGMVWAIPAEAFPLAMPGGDRPNVESMLVTKVGWRRQYWRHGYAAPYVYPPAYGYYAPAYPYAYYPPARGYYVPVPPNGDYPEADDYADYPAAEGDYPAPDGEYTDGPPPGGY